MLPCICCATSGLRPILALTRVINGHYASLIFIVANRLRLTAAINYARRENDRAASLQPDFPVPYPLPRLHLDLAGDGFVHVNETAVAGFAEPVPLRGDIQLPVGKEPILVAVFHGPGLLPFGA